MYYSLDLKGNRHRLHKSFIFANLAAHDALGWKKLMYIVEIKSRWNYTISKNGIQHQWIFLRLSLKECWFWYDINQLGGWIFVEVIAGIIMCIVSTSPCNSVQWFLCFRPVEYLYYQHSISVQLEILWKEIPWFYSTVYFA